MVAVTGGAWAVEGLPVGLAHLTQEVSRSFLRGWRPVLVLVLVELHDHRVGLTRLADPDLVLLLAVTGQHGNDVPSLADSAHPRVVTLHAHA
jgi:hypothetical protein